MKSSEILQIALAFLPVINTGVNEFIAWLTTVRAAARQSGEWTPEQDAAFEAAIAAKKNDPAYLPDPPEQG